MYLWILKRLRSETKSHLKENENKDNETYFGMKYASAAFKICFGKFK